jgi:hypothetical protein
MELEVQKMGSDVSPFPWEYIAFDEILFDLKMAPESIDIPVPR